MFVYNNNNNVNYLIIYFLNVVNVNKTDSARRHVTEINSPKLRMMGMREHLASNGRVTRAEIPTSTNGTSTNGYLEKLKLSGTKIIIKQYYEHYRHIAGTV